MTWRSYCPLPTALFPEKRSVGPRLPLASAETHITQGGAHMMPDSIFQMNARPASSVNEWLDPTRNLDWIAAAVHPD